ncbi:MAG: FtsK/SpoIIIE domain-containing protein [Solirubrobacteraceae bacterium]
MIVLLAGWLLMVWAIVKRPLLSVPLAAYIALVIWLGPHDAQALVVWALIALGVWRLAHKSSFQRLIGRRLRSSWRRLWVYDRRWRRTMVLCGLGKRYRMREGVPKIRKVYSTAWCDRVLIGLVGGQCTEDVERAASQLAHSFGALACRVREDRPRRVWLEFMTADPLVETVPALPVPDEVDLRAVAIGRQENGEPWRLPVRGEHLLTAGMMGSGKGSVLWSILRGLAPAIRDGRVAVWAIDPKGGMELGPGRALYVRFAVPTATDRPYDEIVELLEDLVKVMQQRALGLDGVTRLHEPTSTDPQIVLVIDEIANLTAYLTDRKVKDRIKQALGLLLTQGRAVGISVIAALQDPRREVIELRNLFPLRVALRLDTPNEVDMVLGDGAHEQGASCDRIPRSLPGVGYVRVEGIREPTRVRAAKITDEDIADMVATYAAPRAGLDGEVLFQAAEHDVDGEIIELPTGRDKRPEDDGKRAVS